MGWKRLAAATALVCCVTTASLALDEPSKEVLASQIAASLPIYWSVSDIRIVASTNAGDAVEPEFKQRFEALVSPRSNLFLADESAKDAFGPFIPVLPTLAADASRTLYGVATSTYSAGEWLINLKMENDVAGPGMPVDLFGGPTVMRGSEEESQLRERLRADVAVRLQYQLAAEIERLKGDHEARVDALRQKQEEEITGIETAHRAATAKLNADLAMKEASVEAELQRVTMVQSAELEALEVKFEQVRLQLESAHKQERDGIRASHTQLLDEAKRISPTS